MLIIPSLILSCSSVNSEFKQSNEKISLWFFLKEKYSNIKILNYDFVYDYLTKISYPSYVTKALEWAKLAKEYDRYSRKQFYEYKIHEQWRKIKFLQNENIKLKKELNFLKFIKK